MAKKRDHNQRERDEENAPKTAEVVCPCYAGWEAFEKNVRVVLSKLKTGTRNERAYALHVFDDAMRIQSKEDLESAIQPGEFMLDEKRACNFRSMEERMEARRDRLIRRRKCLER